MSSSPSAQLEYFLSCSNLGILTRKMVGSCCYYTTKRRETRFVLLLCFNIIRGLFYVRYCVVKEESPRRCSVIKLSSVAMSTLASQRPTKTHSFAANASPNHCSMSPKWNSFVTYCKADPAWLYFL